MILALSETMQELTAILGWLTPVMIAIAAWINSRASNKAAKVAKDTHTLVNSAMGEKLQNAADDKATIVSLRGLPSDIHAAAQAVRAVERHDEAQAQIDAKNSPSPESKSP